MSKIVIFFKEARIEMLKVNWPTKKQTVNYTLLVIIVSLAVAAFLGSLDYVFGQVLRGFIK